MNCNFPLVVQLNYPLFKSLQARQRQKPNRYGFSKQLWNQHASEIFHLLKKSDVRRQNNCFHQLSFKDISFIGDKYFLLKKRYTVIEMTLLFQQKDQYYSNTVFHLMQIKPIYNLNSLIHEDLFSFSNLYQKNKNGFTAFQLVLSSAFYYKYQKQKIKLFLKYNYEITKDDIVIAKQDSHYKLEIFLKNKYKQQILENYWLMWTLEYDSLVQWLPKELVDELVIMIKLKKRLGWHTWGPNVWFQMARESMTVNPNYRQ